MEWGTPGVKRATSVPFPDFPDHALVSEIVRVHHPSIADALFEQCLARFYRLRSYGLAVTPQQWLTLLEGLARSLHGSSLAGFCSLSRSILPMQTLTVDGVEEPARDLAVG